MSAAFTVPAIPSFPQKEGDPRLAHLLSDSLKKPRVVMAGFPSDLGCERNSGRTGAAKAPNAIREQFYKMAPDPENFDSFTLLVRGLLDLGDLDLCEPESGEDTLSFWQSRYAKELSTYAKSRVPILNLGGSHELSYASFLTQIERGESLEIINIDAHTDLRPTLGGLPHSGSPFSQASEHDSKLLKRYSVFGLSRHAVSSSQLHFLKEHEFPYRFSGEFELKELLGAIRGMNSSAILSLDFDALDSSYAPGVSSPAAFGLDPQFFVQAALEAGRNPSFASLDIAEVNPTYDIDSRTARLAALCVWSFLRGLAERPA